MVLGRQVLNKFLLFIILLFIPIAVRAEANTNVASYEDYMNNLKYFKANFIQDDITNGQMSEGLFYLSRPNKLRVDYNTPFEASLYSDNVLTIYYDKELDEASNIPTTTTPIQFLLKKDLSFSSDDVSIVGIEEDKKSMEISIVENKNKEQGILTFVFKKNPIVLSGIKVKNELGQEVEVEFVNISTTTIKRNIFEFNNPRNRGKI